MPLIVAVDRVVDPEVLRGLCEGVNGIDGVKVGLPAVLRGGLEWASRIAGACSGLRVLDYKLADVEHVMRLTVEPFLESYNVFIAHSFVGAHGALLGLKELLDDRGAKLALVASMSHEGSMEVYDKASPWVEEVIRRVDPWGLIAPATRPSLVRRLRGRFPGKAILSPGVGAQGARPGSALCAGADYEIVGRAIMDSRDPRASAESIVEAQEVALRACR
ncbi:MAG: orotidine 5'-phosphate decarboxylase [Desulfurococcales archaeon]|nr:orotidine 5'-phosphate decarboxylase [Desulfurococcales archaeon]